VCERGGPVRVLRNQQCSAHIVDVSQCLVWFEIVAFSPPSLDSSAQVVTDGLGEVTILGIFSYQGVPLLLCRSSSFNDVKKLHRSPGFSSNHAKCIGWLNHLG